MDGSISALPENFPLLLRSKRALKVHSPRPLTSADFLQLECNSSASESGSSTENLDNLLETYRKDEDEEEK